MKIQITVQLIGDDVPVARCMPQTNLTVAGYTFTDNDAHDAAEEVAGLAASMTHDLLTEGTLR